MLGLSEARTPKLLPEVESLHLYDAAHLVKSGTHGLADAVAESVLHPIRRVWSTKILRTSRCACGKVFLEQLVFTFLSCFVLGFHVAPVRSRSWWSVWKVRRDDRSATIVVTRL